MRYFQGQSVTGPVRESPAKTFREVVDALRICPTLGVTRPAFLALAKRERNEIKQVPFFVPAAFKASPSKRIYAEATCCNLIFLDIDETADGKCPAAPFVRRPETLYTALEGFNFAAHTTASSTPEKPRMRVIVDAEAIPLAGYAQAVATIGALLGLTKLTTESKVAVQPMFLPTLFKDSTEDDHPLIAHRLDARTFTADDISDEAPDYSEPREKRRTAEDATDSLFFLRAPLPEITLGVAATALDSIDPDCSYYEWIECAAALKHQFSPDRADEAYTLFDEWSSGGTKYGTGEETKAKWDSLRPSPIGRLPITIRSLLRLAAQGGWDDTRVRESALAAISRWMEEDVMTLSELTDQGAKKIVAAPQLTSVQEDMLIGAYVKAAKQRFAYSLSPTAVRKDIGKLRAEMRLRATSAEKVKEPKWARGVCFVSTPQEFYRHRTGEKYKVEAFDRIYSRHLLPTEEQLKEQGTAPTAKALSLPIVQPADYALNHLKIAHVYDYAYDPSQPAEMFFVTRGRKYVNTYSPSYPEMDKENASKAGTLFQAHLATLIREPEYRRTLTDFLAAMVQSPGRKIRWAVLIQSVEGAGKTYLAEVMKAVLGPEHVQTIDGACVKSGWNEWAFGKQLIVLEEVRVSGTNRHEIMNTLKPLITNDDIAVNEKFRNSRQIPNLTNYMMFSNHHDALALTPGDRRYFVIKSPLQNKSQVLALGENYFPPLYAMLRDHAGAMRAWLSEWQISPSFNPDGHAPRTKYVEDMVNDSANSLTAAVRRLVLEGDYPLIQYDIVSARKMMEVLMNEEGLGRTTAQQLAQVLREEGFEHKGRHLFGTDRHHLWARGTNGSNVGDVAMDREKNGKKHLGMEIIIDE